MSDVVHDTLRRPLASLRLSVTDRCNLRCRYCMPEDDYAWLPRTSILTFEEIERLTGLFSRLAVPKAPPTAGDPRPRSDTPTPRPRARIPTRTPPSTRTPSLPRPAHAPHTVDSTTHAQH